MRYKVTELRICWAQGCSFAKTESFYSDETHLCPRCGAPTSPSSKSRKFDYAQSAIDQETFRIASTKEQSIGGITGTPSSIMKELESLTDETGKYHRVVEGHALRQHLEESQHKHYERRKKIGYNETDANEHQRAIKSTMDEAERKLRSKGYEGHALANALHERQKRLNPYMVEANISRRA